MKKHYTSSEKSPTRLTATEPKTRLLLGCYLSRSWLAKVGGLNVERYPGAVHLLAEGGEMTAREACRGSFRSVRAVSAAAGAALRAAGPAAVSAAAGTTAGFRE